MLLSSTRAYTGRIIHVDHDTVAFPDASTGTLEMVRHPGAAAVVPLLDQPTAPDPRVLIIRQFRHAADDFIWEVPAGTLAQGETAEQCAIRELEEEAGCRADSVQLLTTVFTTPGFTDERIHLYLAAGVARGPGRPDRDEFITVHEFAWSEVIDLIRTGGIRDGKSLCALFYVHTFLRG